ncbi:MAG: hypothetical protein ACI85K_003792 [Hyphomicrobiaceae bacterium]|jgi:hypothetical protein
MTKKLPLVAFVVAVCTTVALTAQGRGRRRMPPPPALLAIDVDDNGELSNDEIDGAAKSLLTLDKNGDGNLTSDELTPEMPERRGQPGGDQAQGGPPGGPPGGGPGGPPGMGGMSSHPLMKALDKDGDGELFGDEITQAARSLDRLDVDDDDIVSAAELSSRRGGRGGFGRGSRDRTDGYDTTPSPSELRPADGTGVVKDMAHFRELSYQGEEVMVDTHLADQEFVKFQIESADGETPQLYFMNTNKFRAHPMFMQHIGVGGGGRGGPGGGRGGSAEPGQHRMRGVIVYRPMLMSPSGNPGMYTFEFEPNDSYAYKLIRVAYDQLTANAKILRGNLSYNLLPRSKVAWEKEKDVYVQGKIPVFHADDVYGEVGFLPLNKAESYGRLRLMEVGDRPGPRDIVLYRSLPNEMPRVAGVLTGFRQTPLSHVNLRAVQDNVPNAFVIGAATKPEITALIGKYVYYKVHGGGYELREARAEEVDQHFAAMRPSKKQVPVRDLTVKTIRSFANVGFDDGANVGVKAANLATLRTFGLPRDRTPDGFAVPFSFYDAYMLHNGFYKMARTMMAMDEFRNDANFREQALAAFRKAIKKGKTPKWTKGALADVQKKFAKDQSIRCRSSTNNEDLPGFSGAGLYDSFTHHPKEGKLHKSIRQVYASMWNYRAFEEREFFRIDHMAAAMGVVLHANSTDEQVNGVAVTKDVLYQAQHKDLTLYYVNAQMGEDLVTNPDAASVPEELLLSPRNPRTDRVLQRSNRVSNGKSLLSMEHRQQLRSSMRILRDRFARLYDRDDDPTFAMEVEFKVSKQGELLIKQARPWIE